MRRGHVDFIIKRLTVFLHRLFEILNFNRNSFARSAATGEFETIEIKTSTRVRQLSHTIRGQWKYLRVTIKRVPTPPMLNSQQLGNFLLIKPDNRLAIDERYRRALEALIEQLFQRRLVTADVFLHKAHSFLR